MEYIIMPLEIFNEESYILNEQCDQQCGRYCSVNCGDCVLCRVLYE